MINTRITNTLIVASITGLFGFLVWWNINNYHIQKAQLIADLSTQFELARGRYNDSLMVKVFKVVEFQFSDSSAILDKRADTISFFNQSSITNLTISSQGDSLDRFLPAKRQNTDVSVTVSSSNTRDHDSLFFEQSVGTPKFPVKINLNDTTVTDSGFFNKNKYQDGDPFSIRFTDDSRLELIAEYAKTNLAKNRLPSSFSVVDSIDAKMLNVSSAIVIPATQNFGRFPLKGFLFEDYRSFLWWNIADDIGVSLFLLGLVICSFYLMRKVSNEQIKAASLRNQFIANMTHELKTPISTVGVALESIQRFGVANDRQKLEEYIDISKGELSRLDILVDKVLKMSSVSQGADSLHIVPLDLQIITEDVIKSMKLYLEQHQMDVSLSVAGSDFVVMADQIHVTNVIYNLLENAIKYSGDGKAVQVVLADYQEYVKLQVIDHGVGIPRRYHNQVFERFFRVPTDNKHNVKGYGLGLHYAYTIINRLGGGISFSSKEGEGSIFSIELPKANK